MNNKIFLLGPWKQNVGPANVNRALLESDHDNTLMVIRSDNKYLVWIECFFKSIIAGTILVSPPSPQGIMAIKIAKLLGKKTGVLVHGLTQIEGPINHEDNPRFVRIENSTFAQVNQIIAVSEMFSNFLSGLFPYLAYKIVYANNGADFEVRKQCEKDAFSVAIIGGNTPIKNNIPVCEAIQYLHEHVCDKYKLYVFGDMKKSGDPLPEEPYIICRGKLKNEEMLSELDKINTVIVNSVEESFSLASVDALNCRCNLLTSTYVGFRSIGDFGPNDTIFDVNNIEEIANKIEGLTRQENWERLYSTVNRQENTSKAQLDRIKRILSQMT